MDAGVVETTSIMFDVGVIATVGFVGAAFASRARVPIIIGYIIAGMLIGPNIHLHLFGWSYDGILADSVFLQSISQLGLVLLLFFVGLEFSITKLMRTKEAAAVLTVTNLAVNMFAGFVIGAWLGWPLIDTIFMAGVISMSSSAITAKSLIDLKRLGNAETEFLLGMVILESFLAMFLLTLVNGMIVPSDAPVNVGGDDHSVDEREEEHGKERFQDHHAKEELRLRVPEPLQVDQRLRGDRGTRHADDPGHEDRVDQRPSEPRADDESCEHVHREVCHREDRGGFLRPHELRDAEFQADEEEEQDQAELRDALQEHAVRQNSVVRPAEQPKVDVGADQHTRDDVADDDWHTRAGCEGGSDETHRGDDAHVEHDRGRLNHARTHPGGCVAGARALTLSVGEPSFPSRPRIAVHATKRCCCLVDQPLTNPIPFSGVLHHEPARRSQHALIRTSPLSITPSRTRSPWRRWTAARSAMLR